MNKYFLVLSAKVTRSAHHTITHNETFTLLLSSIFRAQNNGISRFLWFISFLNENISLKDGLINIGMSECL